MSLVILTVLLSLSIASPTITAPCHSYNTHGCPLLLTSPTSLSYTPNQSILITWSTNSTYTGPTATPKVCFFDPNGDYSIGLYKREAGGAGTLQLVGWVTEENVQSGNGPSSAWPSVARGSVRGSDGFAFSWRIPSVDQLRRISCASTCDASFYFDIFTTNDVGCRTNGLNLGYFSLPGAGGNGDPSSFLNIDLASDDGVFAADNPVSFTLSATRVSLRTIKVILERVDTAPSASASPTTSEVSTDTSLVLSGKAGTSYQTPVVDSNCGDNCVSYQTGTFTPSSRLISGPYIFYQLRAMTIDDATSGQEYETVSRLFRVELAGSDVSSLTVAGPAGNARFGTKFNVAVTTTNMGGRSIRLAVLADNGRGGGDEVSSGVTWENGNTFTSVDATGSHTKTMGLTLAESVGRGYFFIEATTTETNAPIKVGRSAVFQLSDAVCAQCCLASGSCEATDDGTPFPYATTCCAEDEVCCSVDQSGAAGSFRCCASGRTQCALLAEPVGTTTHTCQPVAPQATQVEEESGLSESTVTAIVAGSVGYCLCVLVCIVLACCGGLTYFTDRDAQKTAANATATATTMTTMGGAFGSTGAAAPYPNNTFAMQQYGYDMSAYGGSYGGQQQQQHQPTGHAAW